MKVKLLFSSVHLYAIFLRHGKYKILFTDSCILYFLLYMFYLASMGKYNYKDMLVKAKRMLKRRRTYLNSALN